MINNFSKALSFTLQFEGGFANNPKDSGGATNFGITQRTYDSYREKKGDVLQSVHFISDPEVSDIYYHNYWLANHCDVLPDRLDIAVFDFSVNAGSEAMKELQTLIGVTPDGIYGAKTMAAVISNYTPELLNAYFDLHEVFYKNLAKKYPKNDIFLRGWLNRTERLRSALTIV